MCRAGRDPGQRPAGDRRRRIVSHLDVDSLDAVLAVEKQEGSSLDGFLENWGLATNSDDDDDGKGDDC